MSKVSIFHVHKNEKFIRAIYLCKHPSAPFWILRFMSDLKRPFTDGVSYMGTGKDGIMVHVCSKKEDGKDYEEGARIVLSGLPEEEHYYTYLLVDERYGASIMVVPARLVDDNEAPLPFVEFEELEPK
jgi:hypothetical protein